MGFICFFGLSGGNFIYQLLTNSDWGTAFERSFFQGVAIAMYAILSSK